MTEKNKNELLEEFIKEVYEIEESLKKQLTDNISALGMDLVYHIQKELENEPHIMRFKDYVDDQGIIFQIYSSPKITYGNIIKTKAKVADRIIALVIREFKYQLKESKIDLDNISFVLDVSTSFDLCKDINDIELAFNFILSVFTDKPDIQ